MSLHFSTWQLDFVEHFNKFLKTSGNTNLKNWNLMVYKHFLWDNCFNMTLNHFVQKNTTLITSNPLYEPDNILSIWFHVLDKLYNYAMNKQYFIS